MYVDVVIIGAGPAGSCAARTAAQAGARVLLLEARRTVGVPVQCAEYVPIRLRDALGEAWPGEVVVQRVEAMRTFLPDGTVQETPAPGMLIDRAAFDQHLARLAVRAGAELWTGTRAIACSERGVLARRRDGSVVEIKATVIIGADGPRSTVARWVGILGGWENGRLEQWESGRVENWKTGKLLLTPKSSNLPTFQPSNSPTFEPPNLLGIQCRVRLHRPLAVTEVYFDPLYVGGYGWRFPKGDTANVGVGLRRDSPLSPRAALAHLLARLEIPRRDVLGYSGGLIPCGGPLPRTRVGNVLLVGDAAGQTHPITGAGIAAACLCGQMAGRAAAQAALSGDLSRLDEYEREWRAWLGGALERAVARRREMDAGWSTDPVALSDLLRRTWIAFPGYGRRRE